MSHLSDKHGISRPRGNKGGGSFGKYLKEHFPVPLCCCGCGQEVILHGKDFGYSLFAPGCKGLNRSRNPSCIEFYLHQEMSVDDAIIALSERQRQTAKRHSTQELKEELSRRSKGNSNPLSYKSLEKRTGKSVSEIKADLSNKSSGSNNGFYGRTHTEENKRKLAKYRSRQTRIVSKPELVIWAWPHSLNVEFEYETCIDTFSVDYLCGNNIIEVYGDYWHSDRMVSDGVNIDKVAKDKAKNEKLTSIGYNVHVFWESEIMKSPKDSFKRLCLILNENQIDYKNEQSSQGSVLDHQREGGTEQTI